MDLSPIRENIERGALARDDWDNTRVIVGGFSLVLRRLRWSYNGGRRRLRVPPRHNRVVLHPDCYVMWDEARPADS
jgi:hypothetical protein